MWTAQRIIEAKYPDAYAFEPEEGNFFPIVVLETLPHEYFVRLREHIKAECARKTKEFSEEIKKRKAQDK